MKIITRELIVSAGGNCDIKNISDEVQGIIKTSKLTEGSCNITSIGSTASVTTIEYEPALIKDFSKVLDKLIPAYSKYLHNDTWGDNNGHSHLRSSIIGTSINIPFIKGELLLGTWQQIIIINFDNKKRDRRVAVQLIGI